MTDNNGFESTENPRETIVPVTTEDVEIPSNSNRERKPFQKATSILMETLETAPERCCSWNRLIDIFGNRQGNFITELRPLRTALTMTQQQLTIFTADLERNNESEELIRVTAESVRSSAVCLTKIITSYTLNIPPEENAMFRQLSYDLCKLYSVIASLLGPKERIPSVVTSNSNQLEEIHIDDRGRFFRDTGSGGKSFEDENSLRERVSRNALNIEKIIKYIDIKTERRWWLRDVLNFSKLFLKLALFVSAAITVIDHQKDTAPVITLSLTIIQGIVEMLDQYFLKHTKPEDLKITAVSTLASQAQIARIA